MMRGAGLVHGAANKAGKAPAGPLFTGGIEHDVVIDGHTWRLHACLTSGGLAMVQPGLVKGLLWGGGGGGTGCVGSGGGGGGVPGFQTIMATTDLVAAIGAGGLGGTTVPGTSFNYDATNGGNTTVTGFTTALGGGHGGEYDNWSAGNGGCGGGGPAASSGNALANGGVGSQGHNGGGGWGAGGFEQGGGGGGAGTAGANATGPSSASANGGDGITSAEIAAWLNECGLGDGGYICGGGAGEGNNNTSPGTGGLGGGGDSVVGTGAYGQAGATNSGGGGGASQGGGLSGTGGAGGSGGFILGYVIA